MAIERREVERRVTAAVLYVGTRATPQTVDKINSGMLESRLVKTFDEIIIKPLLSFTLTEISKAIAVKLLIPSNFGLKWFTYKHLPISFMLFSQQYNPN